MGAGKGQYDLQSNNAADAKSISSSGVGWLIVEQERACGMHSSLPACRAEVKTITDLILLSLEVAILCDFQLCIHL